MKIVVDTNILRDYSRGTKSSKNFRSPLWLRLFRYCKKEGHQLIIPSIVVFEYFSGNEMNSNKNQELAELFLKDLTVVDLDKDIAKIAAGYFRKCQKNINVLDYFIVATTIIIGGELATLSPKHFRIFKDLKLFDFEKLG